MLARRLKIPVTIRSAQGRIVAAGEYDAQINPLGSEPNSVWIMPLDGMRKWFCVKPGEFEWVQQSESTGEEV